MIPDQYVWLLWSSAFLLPWLLVYGLYPQYRHAMLWASLFTMPFGLTEPLFVPEYWSPPSLFDLAINTGFDIESLIFCFAIGGIGAVLYNLLTKRQLLPVDDEERSKPLHRHHYKALAAPFVTFPVLYLLLDWNPIYPAIIAMFIGAYATILCRPDLKRNTWIGGILFLMYYIIFLIGLEITAAEYIERVWNLSALSGIAIIFMPIEELLFAMAFGMYWAGVYEHYTWRK
ncbi:MAG: lycopene cyclase domain-containing protein [Gammaproteobacteria bacterium]|nr:lycopene cyclase domain-containing protein [Gammaproteobacteria bacterium]